MNRHHDPESGPPAGPEAERLRDAIRGLPRPAPEPGYRARVKELFLAPAVTALERRRLGRRPWVWVGVAAAAAAVAIAVRLLSAAPEWQVTGEGVEIRVEGGREPVTLNGTTVLHPGGTLRNTGTGEVRIELPDAVVCDLAPGGEVRLAESSVRGQRLVLVMGTLGGTTGPSFPRAGLWVDLGNVQTHITGTTFSLMTGPDSTCVCVLEGTVAARIDEAIDLTVDPGFRFTVYGDGRPSRRDPLLPGEAAMMEQQKLSARPTP